MSGFGLVSEGFEKDQVGSSAMPHKINPRLSERVNSLTAVLKGNVVMVQELVGNQWNEGDVSCSVIRRVALANSFYAIDAILDTTIRIVRDIVFSQEEIESEVNQNLPFLATTRLVSNLVKNGKGREDAYSAIKKHVVAAREHLRKSGTNNLFDLIQSDSSLGLGAEFLDTLRDPKNLIGHAKGQTEAVVAKAMHVINLYSDSLTYSPSNSI
jgi:adenylosuccinate lyase